MDQEIESKLLADKALIQPLQEVSRDWGPLLLGS